MNKDSGIKPEIKIKRSNPEMDRTFYAPTSAINLKLTIYYLIFQS